MVELALRKGARVMMSDRTRRIDMKSGISAKTLMPEARTRYFESLCSSLIRLTLIQSHTRSSRSKSSTDLLRHSAHAL